MSRVFFADALEGVATFWRIFRRDGVALGFTSHNRDLAFDGLLHRAAPGMVPSAIRRTAGLDPDAVEVQGVLAHDAIAEADLRTGRFDGARIAIGVVDWETLDRAVLVAGELGDVTAGAGAFEAALRSAKASLEIDPVPRTSPTCRARFCDAQCALNPARFTHLAQIVTIDPASERLVVSGGPAHQHLAHGWLRWVDGPHAGRTMHIAGSGADGLQLENPLDPLPAPGTRMILREGCDHTLATCHGRFANAANFRGEPFLPGNDWLTRYPTGAA